MLRTFLFSVFVGAIVGCHKPTGVEAVNYTITGVVLDYDTKLPLAGATVYSTPFPILTVALDKFAVKYNEDRRAGKIGKKNREAILAKNRKDDEDVEEVDGVMA